ncbi:LysR family transcriptional regulator [Sabulicella glaciei]|uniref:LysR family transcriptional regulator n=1 Tax=Sabulicella glaciei TaxID=2984948 RepID=A0ABT3NXC2_9PROT|nr:LysR family transcriptional regulator [Roseococcus sp. MDT2-1-1]MCW8086214.1 LysR family transcriptional regulator [Roseococcus sp. MDT2-1-1]
MQADEGVARRLRIRDLHTLRVVAELGSMAQAAERLALSQSAISKAIAGMERTLGVPLLDRSSRGVVATGYGRILLARSTAMLDELRQGMEELRFLADPTQGEVRVGATEPMTAVVSAVIDHLSRRHARLHFRVEVAHTTELLQRLRDRDLDLAITRVADARAEPDLQAEILFDDALTVVADRSNPLIHRQGATLAELLKEPWALPPYDSFLGRFILKAFQDRGLEPPLATVSTRSVQMWVAMLRTGRFLGIGPSAMLRFPVHYPSLAAVPVELPETRRPIALVTLGDRSLTPASRLFAETARLVSREATEGA